MHSGKLSFVFSGAIIFALALTSAVGTASAKVPDWCKIDHTDEDGKITKIIDPDFEDEPECKKRGSSGEKGAKLCNVENITLEWMTSKVAPVGDASEAVADLVKGISAAIKGEDTDPDSPYALKNFGPPAGGAQPTDAEKELWKTNRKNARDELVKAKDNVTKVISQIAGSANTTCAKCYMINNWRVLEAAVWYVNRTQKYKKDYLHEGPETKGHFSMPGKTSPSYDINRLTEKAMNAPVTKTAIKELREKLLCEAKSAAGFAPDDHKKVARNILKELRKVLIKVEKKNSKFYVPVDDTESTTLGGLAKKLKDSCADPEAFFSNRRDVTAHCPDNDD